MIESKDLEGIREIFEYKEGHLFWKRRPLSHFPNERSFGMWNTRYASTEAGTPDGRGYISIMYKKERFKRHQLVWIYFKGAIPKDQEVDHIDGDKSNDRIDNLRLTSKSENQTNRGKNRNNKSGFKGLRHHKTRWGDYWCARFTFGGESYRSMFPYTEEGRICAIGWLTESKREKQGEFYCERP